MLTYFRRLWRLYVFSNKRIPYSLWQECLNSTPLLNRLGRKDQRRLRKLATLFLHEKTITGAGGLVVDSSMRVCIAAQACVPILNLDLDYYRGWSEIIVYPNSFIPMRNELDANGLVHESRRVLDGEAWGRGPVILSWSSIAESMRLGQASNVIIHELAHKLDMLNGVANGMPPLHANMARENWTKSLSEAFENLEQQLEHFGYSEIDPYAAESPGEFFAVLSELFFEQPDKLCSVYPRAYEQLRLYYRQDPMQRDVANAG